ncbi:MAG: glycosyltransferase [Candidatus Micrarchaeota archaeon]|nr:glycosyltransferase [Candidatus Micrarchaeota archaeon]MDE1849243.1 glycosyltransferase [Candidatus Micrarchaeota archaeon]
MRYNDLTIVLPTLNEEANVGSLIEELSDSYNGVRIIVVDDGSTDGTRRVVDAMARMYKTVSLFDRRNAALGKGLTASVIDGIRRSKTDYVLVMDADFQHPYRHVGELYRKIRGNCDLAVAVRRKVEDWPVDRRIVSKLMIFFGYFVLFITGKELCNDIFSGYFCIRKKKFIETYEQSRRRFVLKGYKVLFDFLKCTKRDSLRIAEVPYTFTSRKHGESKVGISHGLHLIKSFFS